MNIKQIQSILVALVIAIETVLVPVSVYGEQMVSGNEGIESEQSEYADVESSDTEMVLGETLANPDDEEVSAEKAAEVHSYGKKQTLRGVRYESGVPVWDCVYFGNYWQEDTNRDGVADSFDEKSKIKWRVLSVNGMDALLISDRVLDAFWYKNELIDYSYSESTLTWGDSALRNSCLAAIEENAFSDVECTAIISTTNDGINDAVYIPTLSDMTNSSYGWSSANYMTAKNTAYAAYRQYYYNGTITVQSNVNTGYWLQDVSTSTKTSARAITSSGSYGDYNKCNSYLGVRPMLHLNISDTDVWQYAGTVSGDGKESVEMEYCSITKSITDTTPVSALIAGNDYYFRMKMDMELAHGASIIINVTTPSGNSEQYTLTNTNYEDNYTTIYAPMSFNELGDYTYRMTVKLADGSEIVSDCIARDFTVYNSTQKSGVINETVRWKYDTNAKTLSLSGSGKVNELRWKTEISAHVHDIENLEVDEGITSIYLGDFKNAVFLKKLVCPSSLTEIGTSAFKASGLTEIQFSKGLQIISDYSFGGCRNLKTIVIPETVLDIQTNAFANCTKLSSIELNGGKRIATGAFKGTAISSIKLPANLENICSEDAEDVWHTYDSSPFIDCDNLTRIEVDESNNNLVSKDGVLFTKNEKKLILCPPGKSGEYEVPNTVETLGWRAFYGCDSLSEIVLSESLIELNLAALSGTAIKKIIIPETVRAIKHEIGPRTTDSAVYQLFGDDTQINEFTISPSTSINIVKLEANPSYDIPDLSNIKIYGYVNTDAQRFATEWGMSFVSQGVCYDLTFDITDEVIKVINGKRYDEYAELPTPVKEGYIFEGWYTASTGGVEVTNSTIVNVASNQRLYARWSKIINVSSTSVLAIPSQNYTGQAITPLPVITYQGTTLQKDKDYSLSYANNVNPGTATITITGKGNYTGATTIAFKIEVKLAKATVDTLDFTYQKGNLAKLNSKNYFSLYLDFTPVDFAAKYEIELTNNKGKKVKTETIDCTNKDYINKTIKNLTGSVYGVRIRAKHDNVYGEWSQKSYVIRQPRAQARTYKGNVQIKWEKLSGATGYDIYMSTGRNGKYKKVASAGKNTTLKTIKKYNKKKLQSKTYYYYVVAKKKVGSKTYKSSKSFVYKITNKA